MGLMFTRVWLFYLLEVKCFGNFGSLSMTRFNNKRGEYTSNKISYFVLGRGGLMERNPSSECLRSLFSNCP